MLRSLAQWQVKHVVIGGGVVGLAVASRLARQGPTVLLEKNKLIGEETSSRNSEVIHAGIYYPPNSLKTKLCIKGNRMLYKALNKNSIPHKKCGKWIIALNNDETAYLQEMKSKADKLGVPLEFVPQNRIEDEEPNLIAHSALESVSTGVVDSHSFMQYLEHCIEKFEGTIVLNTQVMRMEYDNGSYFIDTDSNGEQCVIQADSVINSAGLHATKIAGMLIPNLPKEYTTYFCKGHYFGYSGKPLVSRLTYPVPEKNLAGLGVHATIDLSGRMRFGPDAVYINNNTDYSVTDQRLEDIYKAVTRYLPNVEKSKLYPDYSGIRPKLSAQGEPARDFLIEEESKFKLPGFVNLIGIESPGLTSSLAIAELVASKLGYKELSIEEYDP